MKKIFVLLIICLLILTGCSKEEIEVESKVLKDEKTGISITINDNIKNDTKLVVKEIDKDYSKLLKSDKYKIYDLSLNNKEKIKNDVKVNLVLPIDYSREKVKVYYISNDKIKEEYDLEINKDRVSFYTNHLFRFALVEVKGE